MKLFSTTILNYFNLFLNNLNKYFYNNTTIKPRNNDISNQIYHLPFKFV
jgi:hypothetical protein